MQIIITVNEDEGTATVDRRGETQPAVVTEGESTRPSPPRSTFESEQSIDAGEPPETIRQVPESETAAGSSSAVQEQPSPPSDTSSSYPGTMIDEFGEEQLGSAITERSEEHAIDVGSSPSLPKKENSETLSDSGETR